MANATLSATGNLTATVSSKELTVELKVGGGGLTTTQVNALVAAGVADWARAGQHCGHTSIQADKRARGRHRRRRGDLG